jgi:hypothetical protein
MTIVARDRAAAACSDRPISRRLARIIVARDA